MINMGKQLAFAVDVDRCIGCHGCKVACKYNNDIALGTSRINTYQMGPVGDFPHLSMYFMTVQCQQCENPSCTAVCPTGACYKDDADGIVHIDKDSCIGCKSCMRACPYHANNFNVQLRAMDKCDMCESLREAGEMPACARNCTGGALFFGDINDPESGISKLLEANRDHVYTLKDENGNNPSGRFILRKEKWIDAIPFEFEKDLKGGMVYD